MSASTKQQARSSQKPEILQEEEVLQAVVIADSFDKKFQPCSLDKPRVLLPLANVPMIDYTLGFLSLAGIEEVIIYCNAHAQQIKDHINKSKWPRVYKVQIIINEESQSVGDALRDLDAKQMISTDFVLIHGDAVANIDLKSIIETHKQTREQDKDAILTMVMKKCPPGHRSRDPNDMSIYGLNKTTNQVLYHRRLAHGNNMKVPVELLKEHKSLQLRYDLLDCEITVCAAMIPSLLTDNFDYQTRDDLVHGVLGNQEILGSTMHVHVIDNGYAARAANLCAYKTLSQDVVERWAFPFVPEQMACDDLAPCEYQAGNVYLAHGFNKDCEIGNNIVIGHNTTCGSNCTFFNCVIGKNCKIGDNVRIENSFLWDHVTVDDDSTISNSVLCDHVHIHKNTHFRGDMSENRISPEFVLASRVEIGPEEILSEPIMLTSDPVEDEWGETTHAFPKCGKEGRAYVFTQVEDSEDESSVENDDMAAGDDGSDDDEVVMDTELFYNELLDMLTRALEEQISAENIVLDINSLKHAYNIQINEVNQMLIEAVIDFPMRKQGVSQSDKLLSQLKPLLKVCKGVFKNYYRSEKSQGECLTAIQTFADEEEHKIAIPILSQVLMFFYQNDIIGEELICSWHSKLAEGAVKKEVTKLVDWFEEAESDSDD